VEITESLIPGSSARACIIAVLHFDFEIATDHSTYGETAIKYKEDATNI
jgi:hypothetical protein